MKHLKSHLNRTHNTSDFDKSFKLMGTVFKVMFGIVSTLILAYFVFIGVVATKVISQDWSGGIKPVIEKLWCCEKGCLDHH
jgi:hypothetical protein